MARIVLFEDNHYIHQLVEMAADGEGHEVVATASTLLGALAVLHAVADGDIVPPPDAYLVDGNLVPGDASGNDARIIVEHLRSLNIPGAVIGFSNHQMSDYGVSVDFDARKNTFAAFDYLAQPVAQ